MSTPLIYCFEDQDVREAVRLMEIKQIRRLAVLNSRKHLVGMISIGDIAVRGGSLSIAGEALKKISEPLSANVQGDFRASA